jgi:asparagine synthase (glutamine-hydrolysing)
MTGALAGCLRFGPAPVDERWLKESIGAARGTASEREGLWIQDRIGLAHRPLAGATAPPGQEQPFVDGSTGCAVAFAGRLHNRAELRTALAPHRRMLEPGSDAAYALAAYLAWGERHVERLIGDFAFAIWDPARRRLLLGCDPLGAGRLCYAVDHERLVFATTAEQLLASGSASREVNEDVLLWYLHGGQSSPPQETFYRDIRFLPGGHVLSASEDGVRVERYWRWPSEPPERFPPPDTLVEEFRALFEEAVACRLADQASAAVFLSGGLDSSAVACVSGSLTREAPDKAVHLYSLVFDQLTQLDERGYSSAVAQRSGLRHVLAPADECWSLAHLEEWLPAWTEPFMGASDAALHMLLRRAQGDGVRVVLFGHGGDHLVAGSPAYLADWLLRGRLRAVHRQLRAQALVHDRSYARRLALSVIHPFAPPPVHRALARRQGSISWDWMPRSLRQRAGGDKAPMPVGRHAWWYWLRDGLAGFGQLPIAGVDLLVRSFGLEQGNPFLDVRLAELVLRAPPDALYRDGKTKVLLREALREELPGIVRERTDKAIMVGLLHRGLRERRSHFVRALLADSELERRGYVVPRAWKRMVERYLEGDDALATQCWVTVTAEVWLRAQVDRLPPAARDGERLVSTG